MPHLIPDRSALRELHQHLASGRPLRGNPKPVTPVFYRERLKADGTIRSFMYTWAELEQASQERMALVDGLPLRHRQAIWIIGLVAWKKAQNAPKRSRAQGSSADF